MTDQLLQYYSDRNRARMGDAAERTFITHDGITVDPPPPPADIEMLSWIPTESTTPSGDQATLEGPEVEEQDLLSEFGDFAGTVFRTIGDLPAAAIRGVLRGGVESASSLGLLDEEQAQRLRRILDESYQEAVEEGVEPITASIVEGVAQIAPAALPVFAALRYAGVARTGAMLIAEAVGGAFSVNPDDPNLGNMAQEFIEPTPGGELATALDLLATDPDDPDWQNRARNGIQDSMLGLAFEGLMRAPGVARKMVERWKAGKSPVPAGMSIEDVGDDILAVEEINPLQIDEVAPGLIPAPDGSPGNTFLQQREPTFIPPGANNKVSPEDIGRFWDGDFVARYSAPGDPLNSVHFSRAVDNAGVEMEFQLQQIETGEGWYDADIRATRRIITQVFPEIRERPLFGYAGDGKGIGPQYLHQLITAISAPMSFNNRPKPNMNTALKIFDIFLEEGRIPSMNPETGKLWSSRSSGRQGLEVLQYLLDTRGVKGTMRWLFTEHPITELRQVKFSSGVFKQTTGSIGIPGIQTDQRLGAYILGPKGGPFFLNLNGIDDTTSDLWDTRNFNRHFGRMMHPDGSLVNQPRSGEREVQKQFNREVGNVHGKNERDSQAIRWYYEQNLNAAMGQSSARPSKFSDGAAEFRDSTLRRVDRDSGADAQPSDVDAVRRSRSDDGGSK